METTANTGEESSSRPKRGYSDRYINAERFDVDVLKNAVTEGLRAHGLVDCREHWVPLFSNGLVTEAGTEVNFEIDGDYLGIDIGLPISGDGTMHFYPTIVGKTTFLQASIAANSEVIFSLDNLIERVVAYVKEGDRLLGQRSSEVFDGPWNKKELMQVESIRSMQRFFLVGFWMGIPIRWEHFEGLFARVVGMIEERGINYEVVTEATALIEGHLQGVAAYEGSNYNGSTSQMLVSTFFRMVLTACAGGMIGYVIGKLRARWKLLSLDK